MNRYNATGRVRVGEVDLMIKVHNIVADNFKQATNYAVVAISNIVFELAQAYVRAVNDLRRIVKEKGAASHEAYEALRVCEAIQRRIKKLQTADRRRNMTVKVLDV